MARRGGKAATRRSRQRRSQRASQASARQAPATPTPAQQAPVQDAPAGDAAPNAFDTADAALRASTPPPGSRPDSGGPRRSVRARTSDFQMVGGSSRLSERAAAEYHYVARDLRNIAVLLVLMVVLLAVSAVVVNTLGIGQG